MFHRVLCFVTLVTLVRVVHWRMRAEDTPEREEREICIILIIIIFIRLMTLSNIPCSLLARMC